MSRSNYIYLDYCETFLNMARKRLSHEDYLNLLLDLGSLIQMKLEDARAQERNRNRAAEDKK